MRACSCESRDYRASAGGGGVNFPEVPIGRAFDIFNGATPASDESAFWDGDIPWVSPADLGKLKTRFIERGRRSITRNGYSSCATQMVPEGTIILSTRAPIGHIAIASQSMCFSQGCRGLRRQGREQLLWSLDAISSRRNEFRFPTLQPRAGLRTFLTARPRQ